MDLRRSLKNNIGLILMLGAGWWWLTYKLTVIPAGVYADEAVVGYDAWSIWRTARDHYGQFLPIYFKFFNSYTPGLAVYLEAGLVGVFGLKTMTIRILSVISMLAVAGMIYIFLKKNKLVELKYSPLMAVGFFLLTPWTVFKARLGYETTIALAILTAGILMYDKPLWSFSLISVATYAGFTERYVAPLVLILIYGLFYFKRQPLKKIWWPIVVTGLMQLPNILFMFNGAFWVKNNNLSHMFWPQYVSYFSPMNLFNHQDYDLQRSIPNLSVFFSWMFIPWLAGGYVAYIKRKQPAFQYLWGLIFLLPIPAALANTTYSTQRALPLLVPYSIMIAMGMDKIGQYLPKIYRVAVIGGLIGISAVLLWRSYFILFPMERAEAWDTGYDQIAKLINSYPNNIVVVDNSREISDILLLFWLNYPPEKFQKDNPLKGNYWSDSSRNSEIKLGNVTVRPINWMIDDCGSKILIGDKLTFSSEQIINHQLRLLKMEVDNRNQIIWQAYLTEKQCR